MMDPIPLNKRVCAVAMLDVLGYTEQLARWGHELLFDKMRFIELKVSEEARDFNEFLKQAGGLVLRTTPLFISDTLVVFSEVVKGLIDDPVAQGSFPSIASASERIEYGLALTNTVRMVASAMGAALVPEGIIGGPVFTYRGAIAVGECVVQPPYFFGTAAVEAARNMERSSTGIVWLCPSAERAACEAEAACVIRREAEYYVGKQIVEDYLEEMIRLDGTVRTPARIRERCSENGRMPGDLECFAFREQEVVAVNPFHVWEPDTWREKAEELLATFTTTDDANAPKIEQKRAEMKDFLIRVGAL